MAETTVEVNSRDVSLVVIAFVALLITVILNVVTLLFVAHTAHDASKQAQSAAETHRAACSFRGYLRTQATNSAKYLVEHPDGVKALGLSKAYVEQQVQKQQAAADALSDLHCNS